MCLVLHDFDANHNKRGAETQQEHDKDEANNAVAKECVNAGSGRGWWMVMRGSEFDVVPFFRLGEGRGVELGMGSGKWHSCGLDVMDGVVTLWVRGKWLWCVC
jgi:hypothetical protein